MKIPVKKILQFLAIDIWKTKGIQGYKARLYRWIKIFIITGKEIAKDKVFIQASALTYFSTLSIVPVIATIFGISKGFGFGKDLKGELGKFFKGQEEILEQSFVYAQNMLDNAKGGLIAGIGIVILIYVVMRLLNNIEVAFNTIWHIKQPRSWVRKFTDYFGIVVFAPILLFVSNSLTVFIRTQIAEISEEIEVLGFIEPIVIFFLNISPYFVIWILFTLVYMIMPNTRVKFKSAMIAGVIAGTVFQLTQWGFITFQIGVSNYNAIYGSFAALPLFLIFTQISWTIVFIGGEISYAHQNVDRYIPDDSNMELSYERKRKTVLLVMSLIVKNFENGEIPLTKVEVSDALQIPYRFVADVMNDLVHAGVLLRSKVNQKEVDVYLPAIDIHKITIEYVFSKLDKDGLNSICAHQNEIMSKIDKTVDQILEEIKSSSANVLVKDL
ncbi:YihY/virulence factor BrkB family protein [Reichenbachiella sp. MALMAid0571]|uniref:YihY/virulence factor BrkB family protein n=1 Tax=Reichenbachiella sp. MALMAid0571 TaxID=3143939 RepID=UPI0032DFC546